jgi:hypothetical protein
MAEWIVPAELHDQIVVKAYRKRGYATKEAVQAAEVARSASWHGIKTHNAIKALHLDELFGSHAGGCVPQAKIEKLKTPYKAVQKWNANKKLGQATAVEAMTVAMKLADKYGIGAVAVDNAFHYLWGGGYVMATSPTPAARRRWRKSCPSAARRPRSARTRIRGGSRRPTRSASRSASTGPRAPSRWAACSSSPAKASRCRRAARWTSTAKKPPTPRK